MVKAGQDLGRGAFGRWRMRSIEIPLQKPKRGLVGFALRPRSVEVDPSDITIDQAPSAPEVDLTPAEAYERAAKEKRRARWAERERALEEPANDRPSIFHEESK